MHLVYFIVVVALSIISFRGFAQQTDWERIQITAARENQSLSALSSNIAVLDSNDIANQQHVHINELLSQTAASWISRGNGQESLIAIRSPVLTGAGACGAFLIAENGIPIRPAGFCNTNQLFEVNTEQAGQINIIRGPGSSLYGSNAVHGLINVLSPDPFRQPPLQLTLESGPDHFRRGKFSLSGSNEQQALLAYGHLSSDEGYQQGAGYRQQKLNLVHAVKQDTFSATSLLSATHLNQDSAGFIQGEKAYQDDKLRRSNPNPNAFRDASSVRLSSRLNWYLADDQTLTVTPYLRHSSMDFLQHWIPWNAVEDNRQTSAGIQAQYQLFWSSMDLTLGLDAEYSDSELIETQAEPFSATIPQGQHYRYNVQGSVLSPWLNARWHANKNTTLTIGLRFDDSQYRYNNQLSDGNACATGTGDCRFYRPADTRVSYQNWSPQVGLVYQWQKQQYLYSNFSVGFRAPQTTELFRLQAGQQVADLQAERLNSIEMGLRGRYNDWDYDVTLFNMGKQHFIFQDTQRQNISNGETRHKGVEVALKYPLSKQLQLNANGTIAQHQYANNIQISDENINGNDIDTAPTAMGQVALQWQSEQGHRASLAWQYLGRYYLDPENSATYPGHRLVHFNAAYALSEQTEITLNIRNLTDKHYAERADFAFGSYRYFIGLPRSIYLGIKYGL